MKNKHGYDHRAAIRAAANTSAAYSLGFHDGYNGGGDDGAEGYPEGCELYHQGWRDGRDYYQIDTAPIKIVDAQGTH